MKLNQLLLIGFIGLLNFSMTAQTFMKGLDGVSRKKTAYITLTDGTELECVIEKLPKKKGNIEEVVYSVEGQKKKMTLEPTDIAHMYLPPSALAKYAAISDVTGNLNKMMSTDMDGEILGKGYTYFESTEVMIKKKKMTLLMQLVNPDYSNGIKVYHDPYSGETMSASVGGMEVAGGIDKSYFVKKGNAPAYKMEKKDYKDGFNELFDGCRALTGLDKKERAWRDLATHIFTFNSKCN